MKLALVFALAIVSLSFGENGPTYRGDYSESMGNTGVASTEGYSSLFINPARLAGDQPKFKFDLSANLGLNSVLLDYATWAADNAKFISQIDSLIAHLDHTVDNKWAPFQQAFVLSGQVQNYSFAIVEDLHYELTIGKAVVTAVPGVGVRFDRIVTVGKGLDGPNGYNFGLALKYVYRRDYPRRLLGTTDEDFYKIKTTLEKPNKTFSDLLDKVQVADKVSHIEQGVGANLGVTKKINEQWNAGVSFIDFPTIMDSELMKPSIDIGFTYQNYFDLLPGLKQKGLVNIDYDHFLIPGIPWFKHLKLGGAVESYIGKRAIANFSLGLNDGYPTCGVRFGYFAYISYTYTAEEMGSQPGEDIRSFHKIKIEMDI